MEIKIIKIENGYLISIGNKTTFCDVPEAICGITSEWVFEEVARADKPNTYGELAKALQQAAVTHGIKDLAYPVKLNAGTPYDSKKDAW